MDVGKLCLGLGLGLGLGLAASSLMLPAQAKEMTLRVPQGASYAVRVTSLKEARYQTTIAQQYDFSCGSAATATLLTYQYGHPVDERQVFLEMYEHGDQAKIRKQGFSLLDMRRYLESEGFQADGFELPL